MFLGTYETKFSGLGRVILPKKLRLGIGRIVILSRGFEPCVWGFERQQFEKEANKQLEVPVTEERARYLRRYLFSQSEPVELDSQGRFIIPSALLTFAKLKENIVIIGAGDHFEIWEKQNWKKHLQEVEVAIGGVS